MAFVASLGAARATAADPFAGRVTFEQLNAAIEAGALAPTNQVGYLVTPAGRTFHLLGSAFIRDASGMRIGKLISYVGDTRDPRTATAEAKELVDAFGLEWHIDRTPVVVVQARVDFDPAKRFNRTTAFHTAFEFSGHGWSQLAEPPPRPGLPKTIGTGPVEVVEFPGFPLDRKALDHAARVSERWLKATDSGDVSGQIKDMSAGQVSDAGVPNGTWQQSLAARARLHRSGSRRELYRLQTWRGEPSATGRRIWVVYSASFVEFNECVEKVELVHEKGAWRVNGFALFVPQAAREALQ